MLHGPGFPRLPQQDGVQEGEIHSCCNLGEPTQLKRAPRWWWEAVVNIQVPKVKPDLGRCCIAVRMVTGVVHQDGGT